MYDNALYTVSRVLAPVPKIRASNYIMAVDPSPPPPFSFLSQKIPKFFGGLMVPYVTVTVL